MSAYLANIVRRGAGLPRVATLSPSVLLTSPRLADTPAAAHRDAEAPAVPSDETASVAPAEARIIGSVAPASPVAPRPPSGINPAAAVPVAPERAPSIDRSPAVESPAPPELVKVLPRPPDSQVIERFDPASVAAPQSDAAALTWTAPQSDPFAPAAPLHVAPRTTAVPLALLTPPKPSAPTAPEPAALHERAEEPLLVQSPTLPSPPASHSVMPAPLLAPSRVPQSSRLPVAPARRDPTLPRAAAAAVASGPVTASRSVSVHIGSIEIHTPTPAPPPAIAVARATDTGSGFDGYLALRRYESWPR